MEEAACSALTAAASGLAAEQRAARARDRDMYRSVGVALAGRLPIHSAALRSSVDDAHLAAAALPSQKPAVPAVRLETVPSPAVEQLPTSAPNHQRAPSQRLRLVDPASDSEDSVICMGADGWREESRECEAAAGDGDSTSTVAGAIAVNGADASCGGAAGMPVRAVRASCVSMLESARRGAYLRRLGLDSGAEDDAEIAAAEDALRRELQQSTLRCTELRSSLHRARALAAQASAATVVATAAGHDVAEATATPCSAEVSSRPRVAERPIKPSPTPHVFGTPEAPPLLHAETYDGAAYAGATMTLDEDDPSDWAVDERCVARHCRGVDRRNATACNANDECLAAACTSFCAQMQLPREDPLSQLSIPHDVNMAGSARALHSPAHHEPADDVAISIGAITVCDAESSKSASLEAVAGPFRALSPHSAAAVRALCAGSVSARARAVRVELTAALGLTELARIEAALRAASSGADIGDEDAVSAAAEEVEAAAARCAADTLEKFIAGLSPASRRLVHEVEALLRMDDAST